MTHHYLPATAKTVHWGFWDGRLPPVLNIKSGDTVMIDTLSGEPEDLPDPTSGMTILPDHSAVLAVGGGGLEPHLLTGPIRERIVTASNAP